MMWFRRLVRRLRVRRELQRRLDVNLEFDDLEGDAADVRNGARLALVSLRSWLDGAQDEVKESETRCTQCDYSDSDDYLKHALEADVGDRCWFWDNFFGQTTRGQLTDVFCDDEGDVVYAINTDDGRRVSIYG